MGVRFLRDIGLGAGSGSGGHGRQILWAAYQDLPPLGTKLIGLLSTHLRKALVFGGDLEGWL